MNRENKEASDIKLIELAQKDKKQFSNLYEKYYKPVFGYIRKRVEQKELSEDLASKVFENALKYIDNYQWQGIPFNVWLFRIARNVLNDYYRYSSRRKNNTSFEAISAIIESESLNPVDEVVRDEIENKLYNAIAQLRRDDQYLLYYKFFEGLSNVEISKITGLSETNVGTKLYRIRKRMKKYFI